MQHVKSQLLGWSNIFWRILWQVTYQEEIIHGHGQCLVYEAHVFGETI